MSSPPPLIRIESNSEQREQARLGMVDPQSEIQQWQTHQLPDASSGDRFRCLEYRLGSLLLWTDDRGSVVPRRVSAPHQCQGATGSLSRSEDLHKAENRASCVSSHRQHNSSLLHQPHGRHSLTEADGTGHSGVGMEPGERDFPLSQAFTWKAESRSRPGVTQESGQLGVDVGPNLVPEDNALSRAMSSGPVCIQALSATGDIHELETGSRGAGNRCSESAMDSLQRLRFSPLCSYWMLPGEGTEGEGPRDDTDSTSMAHTTLVPGPTGNAIPETDPAAEVSQDVVRLPAQDTPSDSSAESSRVASIRSSLQVKEFLGRHQTSFLPLGGKQQRQHTPATGGDGSGGAQSTDMTQCLHQ